MEKSKNRLITSFCILWFFLIALSGAYAQKGTFKGIIMELESSEPIQNVSITNLRTNEEVESSKDGSYQIEAEINDYLQFEMAGYETDTAFIYQEGVIRTYLVQDEATITINEVIVSRFTDSRLDHEIEKAKRESQAIEVGKERGGIRFSLSRIFGKSAKRAKKNLNLLQTEKNNRIIDQRFNNVLIASLTPLSTEEIALFRERYRPNIEFIEEATEEDLRLYIMDAYAKFKSEKKE
ncbi:MAG TPA: hypothetical protein VK102_05105 [Sphingobacterium sp.]|nr:hypothetical protein [Sphingobacterium sp.]